MNMELFKLKCDSNCFAFCLHKKGMGRGGGGGEEERDMKKKYYGENVDYSVQQILRGSGT